MKTLSFTKITLSLSAACLLGSSLTAFAKEQPSVVDPSTGETVSISEVDMSGLTLDQHQDIANQMAQLGMPSDRPGRFGRDDDSGKGHVNDDDGTGRETEGRVGDGHEGEGHGEGGNGGEGNGEGAGDGGDGGEGN